MSKMKVFCSHFTTRFPSPPQNYPKAMHTNTFQSRFKVGDKITDGTQTINIKTVGLNAINGVYYLANDGYIYYENDVANHHLAPRYAVGEKVWYNTSSGIREDIVIDSCDNGSYQIQNSLLSFYTEDQLFPTAEACRAAIKVIPLSR